jgi:UDP-3-O-acyl-N-acetylglucosamine deacetylase
MPAPPHGLVLKGDQEMLEQAYEQFEQQPVDQECMEEDGAYDEHVTTLGRMISVSGPGTFFGSQQRTLMFRPSRQHGWFFDRLDQEDCLPIDVSVRNVWPVPVVPSPVSSIVLLSGSPHNYMRMVEHIIALKVGLGVDGVIISMDSGDPPLFERGSMELVDAFDEAGIVTTSRRAPYVTVSEPVSVVRPNGSFLTLLPAEDGSRRLTVDCAVDFHSAIAKQRIRFTVSPETFRQGALARTNAPLWKMIFCRTVGKLFADTRRLGYTRNNVLIAGPRDYYNEPRLIHGGKSLEAAWHRATLDLLAAIALIDRGRFAGHIVSYKAGHTQDIEMVRELYNQDLLVEM